MSKNSKHQPKKQHKIYRVEPTDEKITGRGGLSLFVKYLEHIQIMQLMLIPMFACLRKSKKGASVEELLKQIICNFIDGTCRHLSYFDQLRKDKAYAALLETKHEDMVSSHTVKRFLNAFTWPIILSFRKIYMAMFIWRLNISKPDIIILDVDAMVMNNDDAEKREGVVPTYKVFSV